MRFSGVNSGAIRGQKQTQTGCSFAWTDAATITMTPGGIDSKAVVLIKSSTETRAVIIKAALTCALTTSGVGGLDTGSEAINKGYYVFLITKPNGKVPKLLCSLSETSPTMPAGYPFRSDPIWFISNNGDGDIRNFTHVNGRCFYTKVGDAQVLTSGTSTSWAAVDCSVVAPNKSRAWFKSTSRAKSTSVWNTINIHTNGSDATSGFRTIWHVNVIRNANGGPGSQQQWEHPMVDAATSVYYHWTTAPGSGGSYPPVFHIWIRGWTLL
ncbi:MAG: hypothetical protein QF704_03540 [Anaerolineales bacterium]|nr:hypothetical protein [Anaerolineales bacterium]